MRVRLSWYASKGEINQANIKVVNRKLSVSIKTLNISTLAWKKPLAKDKRRKSENIVFFLQSICPANMLHKKLFKKVS